MLEAFKDGCLPILDHLTLVSRELELLCSIHYIGLLAYTLVHFAELSNTEKMVVENSVLGINRFGLDEMRGRSRIWGRGNGSLKAW